MINIKLPLPEKISLNTALRKNKFWLNEKKNTYNMYMLEFVRKNHIEPVNENDYPVDIEYTFTFKGKTIDTTNCFFMAKLIEDGLRHSGFLIDDDLRYVTSSKAIVKKGKIDEVEILLV